MRIGKMVVHEKASRFGFTEVGVGGHVGIVNFDVSFLLHAIDHHQKQVVDRQLVHVILLAMIVVFVGVTRTTVARMMNLVVSEASAVQDLAKAMIFGIPITMVKTENFVRVMDGVRSLGRGALLRELAARFFHFGARSVAADQGLVVSLQKLVFLREFVFAAFLFDLELLGTLESKYFGTGIGLLTATTNVALAIGERRARTIMPLTEQRGIVGIRFAFSFGQLLASGLLSTAKLIADETRLQRAIAVGPFEICGNAGQQEEKS